MRALVVCALLVLALNVASGLSVAKLKSQLENRRLVADVVVADVEARADVEDEAETEADADTSVGDLVDNGWGSIFYALNKVSEGAGTCHWASNTQDLIASAFADKVRAALKAILTNAPKGGKALLSAFSGKKLVFVPSLRANDAAFSPCVIASDGTLTADASQTSTWKNTADGQVVQGVLSDKDWEDAKWARFWSNFHSAHGAQATVFVHKDAFGKNHRVPGCTWTKTNAFWKISSPDIQSVSRDDNWGNNKKEFPPYITIAHELLHAYKHMAGTLHSKMTNFNARGLSPTMTHDAAKPNVLSLTWADYPDAEEYNNVRGVTGLVDEDGKNVNENTIRAEAGIEVRCAYLPYDQDGSTI